MSKESLFLIDATAFCYRAFYALKDLRTSSGQATNAIYGFLNILNKILKEQKPDRLICCFDVSRDTFRLAKFAQYKMQREAMPDGLVSQIPIIKEIIRAYGIPIFEQKGLEADDIIAHLARKAAAKKISVTIVSSDKDILQLVDKYISVFSPYKDEGIIYDAAKVKERFGVSPQQVSDIISLVGDIADNIPGVPGIGEVTAKKLITEFGSLDKLLKHISEVEPEKIRESIVAHLDRIKLNKELISLDRKMEMKLDLNQAKVGKPDYPELSRIFKKLEFKKLLSELPETDEEKTPVKLETCGKQEVKDLLRHTEEIFLSGSCADDLVFAIDGKLFDAKSAKDDLYKVISSVRVKKTGHDLKKLKAALFKEDLILNGLDFDTMIAAHLLNPARSSYAISDLALENLGEFIRQGENLEAKEALALIIKLKPVLIKALKEKDLFSLFCDLEMPLVSILAQMEADGIKLDLKLLKNLAHDIEQRLIKLISEIYEASGTQFNINSPKQLGQVLFEKLGLPVIKKTKTGPSTDEEVLNRLASQHALPALLLEYRQLTKLKNTYVDALPKLVDPKDGRVHTSFNQTVTETGRLSSSNPNLQNIPVKTDIGAKIREAIIATGKDNCLLSCDYSQIELRVLAHLCGDETLIKAFRNDNDVHRLTASLINNIAEDKVKDNMREVAKRVNFGIIYGQSAFGLAKDLDIPINQAQDFIDAYFLRYPKVKKYIEAQIKQAQEQGFVTTLFGRRRYLPEINNKNMGIRQFAQRQAVNTPIQGTASDLIKMAMINISEQIKAKELKAKMILQIHDELVFDLPNEELKVLSEMVKDKMEHVYKLNVPIKVDMKKGANWLKMSVWRSNQEGSR
ncbi:MAG: DNA polymerase I [Candidatus Omnitrophica bacterium CG11_big_fil_rev_8_21_14_0_20_41_12]|nr:MAG: DNA polymerase I [Candidatus Omnitrophica bacterium CG11_big_fil_rev_8_21_14_0_20_41_12]